MCQGVLGRFRSNALGLLVATGLRWEQIIPLTLFIAVALFSLKSKNHQSFCSTNAFHDYRIRSNRNIRLLQRS